MIFDHQRHELTLLAHALVDDETDDVEPAYARAVEIDRAECRSRLREPVPSAQAEPIRKLTQPPPDAKRRRRW